MTNFILCVILCTRNDVEWIALCDYNALESEDLSFKKDEQLEVITKFDDGWWLAKSLSTNKEGQIPSNFVMAGAHK